MNRLLIASIFSVGFLMLPGARQAQAQYGGGMSAPYYPYGQPRVSPYLNLIRNQNTPGSSAANYYSGVQPQTQIGYNQQMFSNQVRNLQGEINGLAAGEEEFPTLRATGHMTAFNATGSYFANPGSSMMMQMRYRQVLMRQFPQQRMAQPATSK